MASYLLLMVLGAIALAAGFALETGILSFLGVALVAVGFFLFVRRGQGTSAPGR